MRSERAPGREAGGKDRRGNVVSHHRKKQPNPAMLLAGGVLAAVLTLSACAQPQVPKDRYYRLQVAVPEAAQGRAKLAGTLEIERLVAEGLSAGRPIVYSESNNPNELLEYSYHFWMDPPVVMLRDQLIDCLRAAKVADMVVSPELRTNPDYSLVAKIKRLENIVGASHKGVVELELALRRENGGGKVLLLDTYRAEVAAETGSIGDAVKAMNRGLSDICSRFVADIGKL